MGAQIDQQGQLKCSFFKSKYVCVFITKELPVSFCFEACIKEMWSANTQHFSSVIVSVG